MLKIAPVPTAMETAIKKASEAFVIPDKKSPAIVSRIAFVIVSPGTSSIIEPIIVLSKLEHIFNFKNVIAKIAHNPLQKEFTKKTFKFNFKHSIAKIAHSPPQKEFTKKTFIFNF